MSLPQQSTASPPLSSSSKQSIPGPPGPSAPAPPPTSRPEHEQSHHDNIASQHYENDHLSSEHPSVPNHPLNPFFTLIEDANTGEYHHPTVHYIFSDDDTDILTEAAVRSLEGEQGNSSNTATKGINKQQQQRQQQHQTSYHEEDELIAGSRKAESLLPPPIPGARDNYIILDVEPTSVDTSPKIPDPDPNPAGVTRSPISTSPANQTAVPPPQQQQQQQQQQTLPQFKVTSAHSLTPAWQILNTELVPAPTFENNSSGEQPVNGGLMLKIHGTPGLPPTTLAKDKDRDREKERGSQRLEDMMDQFAKRMAELRLVIDAGELPTDQHHQEQQQPQQQTGEQNPHEDQPAEGDNNENNNVDNNTTIAATGQEEQTGQ